jgi:hypothetical protein
MSLSHPNPAAAMGKGGSPPTAPSAEMAASFLFGAYNRAMVECDTLNDLAIARVVSPASNLDRASMR